LCGSLWSSVLERRGPWIKSRPSSAVCHRALEKCNLSLALAEPNMKISGNGTRVPLSPLHTIELAEGLSHLLTNPPEKDFPIYSIARKTSPDGRELVHSELVIAGKRSRKTYPLADQYPVHFLKSYHPWSFHGDPGVEFENNRAAAEILGTPEPIGFDNNSFRAPFVPGKPLSKLSPFTNIEPPQRCLGIAQETEPAALIGLWRLVEEVFAQLDKLHAVRFCHGDMELHNVVVCMAPIQTFLVDFESSERAFSGPETTWEERRSRDLFELLRLAIYLQCGLGSQHGELARKSVEDLPKLFDRASTFAARLDAADRGTVAGKDKK
jgi:hypothetical protein